MYETLKEVSQELEDLPNTILSEGQSLKICQAFKAAANDIDKISSSSQSIEESMVIAKLHQGMLACERLMQQVMEFNRHQSTKER